MDPKPHAVCFPAPVQGHVKPMLQLAKLLFNRGFHITFVLAASTRKTLLDSRGPNALLGSPGFRFEAVPDDFDEGGDDNCPPPVKAQRLSAPFRDLVSRLNDDGETSDVPRVSCVVSDSLMLFAPEVAREIGVPVALLCTGAACYFMGLYYISALRNKGFVPLRDESYLENGYLYTIIDGIPGMKDMRLKDFPSYIRTTNSNDAGVAFAMQEAEKRSEALAIVLNTFHALEHDVLEALSSRFAPQVHSIGPLQLLLDKFPTNPNLESIGHSLFKEDEGCLQWLEPRPPGLIVYVNFGSLVVLTREQLLEFGWGLANSGHPFLWVIRPGMVIDGLSHSLPREFVEETRERGMVTNWCPQERVLGHRAVGGFLTHCGWNSTVESISAGVPMLCWPFIFDQPTNCRYTCREWGIGMEIESNVKRDEVEKALRKMMEGEKGKEMRNKAMERKRKAEEATSVNGSSTIALENLVKVLLSKQ